MVLSTIVTIKGCKPHVYPAFLCTCALTVCQCVFYAPRDEDQGGGGIFFCPVCHSVLLFETLTFLITFGQFVPEP